jgi:hypothetical protein
MGKVTMKIVNPESAVLTIRVHSRVFVVQKEREIVHISSYTGKGEKPIY